MKILVSCEDFYPIGGGAEAWLEEVLPLLGSDHEVDIHYVGTPHPERKHYACHPVSKYSALKFPILKRTLIRHYLANLRWEKHLRNIVGQNKPDIIITQLMYTPSTVDIADEFDIPVVVYLHNYEHFDPFLFKSSDPYASTEERKKSWPWSVKLQLPFVRPLLRWHEEALRKATRIISNSQSMADILMHHYGLDSDVLFPVADIERYQTIPEDDYVMFINPIKAKGAEVFLRVAQQMPNTKFMAVGGAFPEYLEQVKALSNVVHRDWSSDMKSLFSKARLLMAPSLWPEPFGRVPMEAGISGIPSIVSDRGGLPEAAGKGGIVIEDYRDPKEWVKAIKKFDNKSFYNKMSANAKVHAKNYTKQKQYKRLMHILKSNRK